MTKKSKLEQSIADRIDEINKAEANVARLENELSNNPQFQAWLDAQRQLKEANKKNDEFFDDLQAKMESRASRTGDATIKGDWGYITLVERIGWEFDESELPPRFFKKVPDAAKITELYKLTETIPKGAKLKITKYLKKGIK